MYIQTSSTFDKDSGSKVGVRPEKAKATPYVKVTSPNRWKGDDDRQTCVIVTRIDLSSCASFVDYSKLWMASDMVYPKPERNHDYRGLSKIIYELMSLSSTIF